MSTVFEKFKKTIDKGVATVSVKSNSMLETNKIKVHMNSLTEKMEKKKFELGELVYNIYLDNEPDEEGIRDICEEIKELNEQILERQKEIENIKKEEEEILGAGDKKVQCTCGNMVPEGFRFCTECGQKIE